MIYPYNCEKCDKEHSIVKSMHDAARDEYCPDCQNLLTRVWTSFQFMGAAVQHAEYNPGLGTVVKNKRHRAEIADRRNLIELGSETPETIYKETVVKRAKEREKEWENL